ncbi:MAG: GIY-YIG nuclease family protein [Candidatus Omnitrophica bacterium]|nr:GIY-YIG nuclease family protein [Candidatus Omnitrophota bacterium]
MSIQKKEDILDAIRQTAKENSGKPLGVAKFEKETGINPYDWGKYWARFGDAQKEAGFVPNQLQGAHAEDFLIEKIIGLVRGLGKFPTYREIAVEKNNDTSMPSNTVFQRLGTKAELATKVIKYCKAKGNYDDVIQLCQAVFANSNVDVKFDNSSVGQTIGEVYIFKSGRYYKIGKTSDPVRRGKELRIQLPDKMDLIHSIKTDDPSGVEAYWHKRFEAKRKQGEWFDLDTADVKAFKRWIRIV